MFIKKSVIAVFLGFSLFTNVDRAEAQTLETYTREQIQGSLNYSKKKLERYCKKIDDLKLKIISLGHDVSLVKVGQKIVNDQMDELHKAGKAFETFYVGGFFSTKKAVGLQTVEMRDLYSRWLSRERRLEVVEREIAAAKWDVRIAETNKTDSKNELARLEEILKLKPLPKDPPPETGKTKKNLDKIKEPTDRADKKLQDAEDELKKIEKEVKDGKTLVDKYQKAFDEWVKIQPPRKGNPGLKPDPKPETVPDGIAVGVPPSAQGDTAVAIGEGEIAPPKRDPTPGPIFQIELNGGWRFGRLPDKNIGVINLGTNLNPLITLDQRLNGPFVKGGFNLGPFGGDGPETGWVGGINGEYGHLTGATGQTINAFSPGQLPTYIDLTGRGGFGFNNNARVNSQSTLDIYKISTEFGFRIPVQNSVSFKPYAGAFYRRSNLNTRTTLDTDFAGGTFFNTLNESLILDQFGADVGLDVRIRLAPRITFTLGGHVGLANTNARYNGSDCGDGSIVTPGCDGGLFLNNGVGANNNSVDIFGGIKAALTAYVFCRNNSAVVAAVIIDVAVQAIKDNCVELTVTGTYDNYPGQQVNYSNTLGGSGVSLGNDRSEYGAIMIGAKIKF